MSAQGWKPGEYLGARDASHAEHYTAANASHIRIQLREDNLGLGAKIGKGSADTFGLSLYSGLLSRLNGKSEGEVAQQQRALQDAELRNYQAQKYGMMNFVRGGLLVGDEMKPVGLEDTKTSRKRSQEGDADGSARTSKKAKKTEGALNVDKPKEDSLAKIANSGDVATEKTRSDSTTKVGSKSKKRRTKEHTEARDTIDSDQLVRSEKRERREKEDKRARKEERRKRKEERRRSKSKSPTTAIDATALQSDGLSTTSVPATNINRLAVRHRYIHQKRLASLDPQAMRGIFMISS